MSTVRVAGVKPQLTVSSEELAISNEKADRRVCKRYFQTSTTILDPQNFLTAKSKKSKKFLFKLLKT
jgi:hypothetical protein